MEGLDATALAPLLSSGVLGPILIAMAYAYKQLQARYEALQEKRVAEAQEYAERMVKVAETVRDNTAATKQLADLLLKGGGR